MIQPKHTLLAVYRTIKERAATVEGCSVALLVAPDVDALAACKMLTSLLQLDYITYTIKPVRSYSDVADRFAQLRGSMSESVRTVIMLNCGGMVDLTDPLYALKVPAAVDGAEDGDALVVVIDSHRPFHLENVRADTHNVLVIDDGMEQAEANDLVEVCLTLEEREPDELDDDDDDDDDDELLGGSDERARAEARRRLNDGSYAALSPNSKRGFRRQAVAHHRNYYRGTSSSQSAASLCLELAIAQNRVSNELLWLSAVGLTDQFVHERICSATYASDVERHQRLVLARNADDAANAPTTRHVDEATGDVVEVAVTGGRAVTRLIFESELRFLLYRHWSLYDAMLHSAYVASRFGTWAERGEARLRQLFASMGIPLAQVRQKWAYMDERLKRELPDKLAEWAPRFGLGDYSYASFVKVTAYRTQIAAADVVCAVSALLESCGGSDAGASGAGAAAAGAEPPTGDENDAGNAAAADAAADAADAAAEAKAAAASWERSFWRAYDALGAHSADEPELAAGLELATQLQRAVVETGKLVIEDRKWLHTGKFVRVMLGECPALRFFLNSPMSLARLALFLSDAQRDSGVKLKPIVVAAPDVLRKQHLVIAITGSARFGGVSCNEFGTHFRKAAEDMNAEISQERFDASAIFIASSDLNVFLTHLVHVH